ncbi:hypothetical protein B0H13DRAFT_1900235 [Mycena leptocephala]|nr:hypothetical protein B0H13DRAFT_1900235 [Mycena leptocephala]
MTLHDKTPVETAIIRPDGSGRDTVSREFNLNHSTVNSSLQNRKAVPEIIYIRTSIDDVIKHWSLLRQLASAHLKLWPLHMKSTILPSTLPWPFFRCCVGIQLGCSQAKPNGLYRQLQLEPKFGMASAMLLRR